MTRFQTGDFFQAMAGKNKQRSGQITRYKKPDIFTSQRKPEQRRAHKGPVE